MKEYVLQSIFQLEGSEVLILGCMIRHFKLGRESRDRRELSISIE